MSLHCQSLISPNPQAENLTLIHGWGAENSVWLDWAETHLLADFNIYLIELPGFGKSPDLEEKLEIKDIEEKWLQALLEVLPEQTHLAGWSLGGLLCQKLALKSPEKVLSLINIASTPRFTQLDGWQTAISPQLLVDFIKALGIEYGSVLKQFWRLQLQGSDNARPLMKKLQKHMMDRSLPSYTGLLHGLYLLRDMNNLEAIADITQPTLWLLGEHDPLIPVELAETVKSLQANAEVQIITGASHMPFFSHPEISAQLITQFTKNQA